MRKSRRISSALAVVLAVAGLAACGSSDSEEAPSSGEQLADIDELIIGASVAKTGAQTFYGGPAMVSVQEAIDDINAAGGVDGKQIRLIWEDSQTDFAKSAAAAEKVIAEGAHVLLVDCDFDYGVPAAQVAQERGLVAMNLCAGSPRAGDPTILPTGFSMGIATNVEAAAIAEHAYNELGYRTVYQLRDNSIEYSKSVCDYFADAWTSLGGEIVGEDEFSNSDTSLQSQVSKLRSAEGDYDAINLCTYNPGLTTAVRQIRPPGSTLRSSAASPGTATAGSAMRAWALSPTSTSRRTRACTATTRGPRSTTWCRRSRRRWARCLHLLHDPRLQRDRGAGAGDRGGREHGGGRRGGGARDLRERRAPGRTGHLQL